MEEPPHHTQPLPSSHLRRRRRLLHPFNNRWRSQSLEKFEEKRERSPSINITDTYLYHKFCEPELIRFSFPFSNLKKNKKKNPSTGLTKKILFLPLSASSSGECICQESKDERVDPVFLTLIATTSQSRTKLRFRTGFADPLPGKESSFFCVRWTISSIHDLTRHRRDKTLIPRITFGGVRFLVDLLRNHKWDHRNLIPINKIVCVWFCGLNATFGKGDCGLDWFQGWNP